MIKMPRKTLLFVCFSLWLSVLISEAQSHKKDYLIAFYNLENLFDTINDDGVRDGAFTPQGSNEWTSERYQSKLNHLGEAINAIGVSENYTNGPDVLGLCEVENRGVLEDLVAHESLAKRKYQIVHSNSPDKRGIDVALLYNKKRFKLIESKSYPLYLVNPVSGKRIYTRDQLLVVGELNGTKINFIVNHWPSRFGGEMRSRPLRMAAAQLSRHIADSLLKADSLANVVFMGDFNDDPTNSSMVDYLGAALDSSDMKPRHLYNTSAPLFLEEKGSLCYRGAWNMFDQMVVSQPLLNKTSRTLKFKSFSVERAEILIQQDGAYKGYPLRTYAGKKYLDGYSDHLPVYIFLSKQ